MALADTSQTERTRRTRAQLLATWRIVNASPKKEQGPSGRGTDESVRQVRTLGQKIYIRESPSGFRENKFPCGCSPN
jgi:hypothetical protein